MQDSAFEEIIRKYPDISMVQPMPWGEPRAEDIEALEKKYSVRFPTSYKAHQLWYWDRIYVHREDLQWARCGLPPYLAQETNLIRAFDLGIQDQAIPFCSVDDGCMWCFDIREPSLSEPKISFWDSFSRTFLIGERFESDNYYHWISAGLQWVREFRKSEP